MSKYKKKIVTENGGFSEDFLSLAPPKPKDPPSYLGHYIPELPDFDALPYQVKTNSHHFLYIGILAAQVISIYFIPKRLNFTKCKNISESIR